MVQSGKRATEERIRWAVAAIVKVIIFTLALSWQGAAAARETVAEQLLDIMKARHEITEKQYKDLKKQAQEEQAAMRAAITRQVEKQLEGQKAAIAEQVKRQTEGQKAVIAEEVKKQTAKQTKAQAAALAAQLKATPTEVVAKKEPYRFETVWRNGIVTQSLNGNFKLHVGGYGEIDFGGMNADNALEGLARATGTTATGYGTEIRRFRPTMTGTLWGDIDFEGQMDFGGGNVRATNVWTKLKGIPYIGNIQIGHQKENFSLEALTSDEWTTFMERALPNTFAVGNPYKAYNTGIKVYNQALDKRMTWAVGGYINQSNSSGSFFNNYANTDLAVRLTALPWCADNGRDLLHVGLSYSYRAREASHPGLEYQSTPEFHLTNTYTIDTGLLPATAANTLDPELALVLGPFSLRGEYFNAMVNANGKLPVNTVSNLAGTKIANPDFDGYYMEACYFLTGERRPYDKNQGIFTRPIPLHNFNIKDGGWGAWELTARFSNTNLSNGGVTGGDENDVTAGINWYLNPNVKLQLNYIYAHIFDRTYVVGSGSSASLKTVNDGNAHIVGMRMLYDF